MQKRRPKRNKGRFNFIRWQNIQIRFKYLLAFFITIALFLIATVIVYSQLQVAKQDVNTIINQNELSNELAQIALLIERKDSYVSNYILVNNSSDIELYEDVSKTLNELLQKVEPHFVTAESEPVYDRIVQNSTEIDDLFLDTIIKTDIERSEQIGAQIQIDSKKVSSVTLINRLIDNVTADQNVAVTRTNNNLDKSTLYLMIANVIAIIFGSLIMFFISRFISNNLNKVVTVTKELANGNLAVPPVVYDGRDEIGQLAQAINSLRDNTYHVITEVTDASQSVTNRSEQLTQAAKDVQLGSEQVTVTMDELASGAETQATSATNLSENMQQFVESISESQQDGQTIANNSTNILSLTSDGAQLMEQSVNQMERIDTIVADAVNKVRGLDEQSEQISDLVSVVKNIAEQTNLLSLNAAIEAARAGEHGKGFAVVANEVRALADGVTESVTEITNIVDNIQTETNNVVTSLDKGYKEVEEGIVQIEKTGESFSTIDQSITEMAQQITQIASRLNDVAQNGTNMNSLIEDIAAVSEEAAAGVEQSAASTQETTSAMDEVTRNASELEELAQLLHKEIARFKLS